MPLATPHAHDPSHDPKLNTLGRMSASSKAPVETHEEVQNPRGRTKTRRLAAAPYRALASASGTQVRQSSRTESPASRLALGPVMELSDVRDKAEGRKKVVVLRELHRAIIYTTG
jgi:hypothetical protein